MSGWNSGYVVDVDYTHGFYAELSPAHLSLVSLLSGKASHEASLKTYCELGCGQGFTANTLAASNPAVEFYATDFNPSHIAGAQRLADEAELKNIHFYESSFDVFSDEPSLPQFDFIVLHGIYSWVAAEHRHSIIEFIRRKLKPGGLAYVSYNALPGWSAAAPMRHLIYLHGKGEASTARVESAIGFMEQLEQANAAYFRAAPQVKARLEQLKTHNPHYLVHEYMNEVWTPFYHSDVAKDMRSAKLTFIGSAEVLDYVDAVNLTAEQQTLLAGQPDPTLRETIRDYIINRQFRKDVFAKGYLALTSAELLQKWMNARFVLTKLRSEVPEKVKGALGEATLHASIYDPILDALANGPRTVQELFTLPSIAPLGWAALQQALTILAGANHIAPCLDMTGDTERASRTRPFNLAVMRRACFSENLQYLASPITGSGYRLGRADLLFLLCHEQKHKAPERFVWDLFKGQNQRLLKDGKVLDSEQDNLVELNARYEAFLAKRLPVLQQLGIA